MKILKTPQHLIRHHLNINRTQLPGRSLELCQCFGDLLFDDGAVEGMADGEMCTNKKSCPIGQLLLLGGDSRIRTFAFLFSLVLQ